MDTAVGFVIFAVILTVVLGGIVAICRLLVWWCIQDSLKRFRDDLHRRNIEEWRNMK